MSGIIVIVRSTDGRPVPDVSGALKLAQAAAQAGWEVRSGYALAYVPDTLFVSGERVGLVKKPAHLLATVGVLFRRQGERGWAIWRSVDGGRWSYDYAYCDGVRFGARAILERVALFPRALRSMT